MLRLSLATGASNSQSFSGNEDFPSLIWRISTVVQGKVDGTRVTQDLFTRAVDVSKLAITDGCGLVNPLKQGEGHSGTACQLRGATGRCGQKTGVHIRAKIVVKAIEHGPFMQVVQA